MAHFRRFGPLSYRLAMAMLGDEERAAQALETVFANFGQDGAQWPQWHVALAAVHGHCGQGVRETHPGDRVAPATTPPPVLSSDEDNISLPASTVHGALAALSDSDRDILWGTLMGTNTDRSDWETLSDALRRLEIAITNEDIPSEGAT